eukprot:7153364-Prymnesium_polylepis.4
MRRPLGANMCARARAVGGDWAHSPLGAPGRPAAMLPRRGSKRGKGGRIRADLDAPRRGPFGRVCGRCRRMAGEPRTACRHRHLCREAREAAGNRAGQRCERARHRRWA